MSQPNALLILGDHPFLNYKKQNGQRGLINTAGTINPMLALPSGKRLHNYGKSPFFNMCNGKAHYFYGHFQ